jgi:RecJ-like exonuclease
MPPHLDGSSDPSVHVLTRGNVDGILSSAFALAVHPNARVTYVPSTGGAIGHLRRDLSSDLFVVADLGCTPDLAKTLESKHEADQSVLVLDHHPKWAAEAAGDLGDLERVDVDARRGPSAASIALSHWAGRDRLQASVRMQGLAAVADVADRCGGRHLEASVRRWGRDTVEVEARTLDYAWRLEVEDDAFRRSAARRLAAGSWPSEIEEVRRRHRRVVQEARWPRARRRARESLEVRGDVAVLDTRRERPNLLGFGARALTAAARDQGCSLAALVHADGPEASVSLRSADGDGGDDVDLGAFIEDFTHEHGVAGGGHPDAAGGRVPRATVPTLLSELAEAA